MTNDEIGEKLAVIEAKVTEGFKSVDARLSSLEAEKKTLVDCITAHEKKTLEAKTLAEGARSGVSGLWVAGIAFGTTLAGAIIGLYHWIIQHVSGGKP